MSVRNENTIKEIEHKIDRLKMEISYCEIELNKAKKAKRDEDFKVVVALVEEINEAINKIRELGFSIDLEDCNRRHGKEIECIECDTVYKSVMVKEV